MTESCPNCDYSMRGLPDRHNCPECGFAYDRSADVIRCGSLIPIVGAIVAGIPLLGALVGIGTDGLSSVWDIGKLVLLAAVEGFFLRQALRQLKRRRRAVLDGDGISLIGSDAAVTRFSWSNIDRVEFGKLVGDAQIFARYGTGHVGIDRAFFGSSRKVRLFVASANEWLARYRAESESAGEMSA